MSSTIKQAIQALKGRIADAYTAIVAKGGTLPATQDSANLPDAIASIPDPSGPIKTKIMNINGISNLYSFSTDEELHEEVLDFNQKEFGDWTNESVFRNCSNVKKIDLSGWNCKLARTCPNMFYNDQMLEEVYMNGTFSIASTNNPVNANGWFYNNFRLKVLRVGSWFVRVQNFNISPTDMDRDAIVQFFNDIGTAYDNTQVITLGAAKLALLSNEDKAIATSKGWTLA